MSDEKRNTVEPTPGNLTDALLRVANVDPTPENDNPRTSDPEVGAHGRTEASVRARAEEWVREQRNFWQEQLDQGDREDARSPLEMYDLILDLFQPEDVEPVAFGVMDEGGVVVRAQVNGLLAEDECDEFSRHYRPGELVPLFARAPAKIATVWPKRSLIYADTSPQDQRIARIRAALEEWGDGAQSCVEIRAILDLPLYTSLQQEPVGVLHPDGEACLQDGKIVDVYPMNLAGPSDIPLYTSPPSVEPDHREAYMRGMKDGLTAYAWWKDGVQYVGTCGQTLEAAIVLAEEGDESE